MTTSPEAQSSTNSMFRGGRVMASEIIKVVDGTVELQESSTDCKAWFVSF